MVSFMLKHTTRMATSASNLQLPEAVICSLKELDPVSRPRALYQ